MESLLVRDCCIVIIIAQSIPSVPIPPKAFLKCWHLLWLSTPEHERKKLLKPSWTTLGHSWASRILHLALPLSNKRRMGGEWGISRPRPKTHLSIPNNAFWARHGLSPRTAKQTCQIRTIKKKARKTKLKNLTKGGVLFHSFLSCIVAVTKISPGR